MQVTKHNSTYYRFSIQDEGKEIARAYLFLVKNDLHKEPYGVIEDVFVDELYRGKGLGTSVVMAAIEKAKEVGCYKLIAQSRYRKEKVHDLYKKLGFTDHGKNFRITF